MFKSIKWNIKIFAILMVLTTSVLTMMLVSYKQTGKIEFTFDTLIVVAIGVLILASVIVASIITDQGPMIAILKMDYVKNFTHQVDFVDDKIGIGIVEIHF